MYGSGAAVRIAGILRLVLVARFTLISVVLTALSLRTVFGSHLLATLLNAAFSGVLPITVALNVGKAYVRNNTVEIMWISCGKLSFVLSPATGE